MLFCAINRLPLRYMGGVVNGHTRMEQRDKEWLARYRRGDAEALGEMVEHYRRPLFGFILKMTEGRDEAEDIFQEVWVRAIRHLDTFKERRLLSWLFRIAHNLVIDRARKRKPDESLQDVRDGRPALEERTPSPGASPADEVENADMKDRIMKAVNRLPPDQKAVFLMRMDGDLPFKEIARIQGVSINTALARMQYALDKLRVDLAGEYETLSRN
jgi:RNA polymerase sigma-70 factor, ECF subfamily